MLYYIHSFLPHPLSLRCLLWFWLRTPFTVPAYSGYEISPFFRKSWGIGVPPPKDLQWVQNHIGGRISAGSVTPTVLSRSVNNSDPPTPHPYQPYCASAAPTCLALDIAEGYKGR